MEAPTLGDDRSAAAPRPHAREPNGRIETLPRRIEWIAIVLVVFNTVLMFFSMSLYYDNTAMGQAVIALDTATALVLVLSVILSIFGLSRFSVIALGVGLAAMMVSIALLGFELIDRLASEAYILG